MLLNSTQWRRGPVLALASVPAGVWNAWGTQPRELKSRPLSDADISRPGPWASDGVGAERKLGYKLKVSVCVVRWVVSPPESPKWSRCCLFALASSSVKCRAATGRRVASTAYLASNELLLPIQAIGRTAYTSTAPFLSHT